MTRVLMIVAPEDFRDEEYFRPKKVFESRDYEVVTASTKKGQLSGFKGRTTQAEATIDEVDPRDFDAVVFVGGPGARTYFNNQRALEIARQTSDHSKVLGAICIAPTVLANANVMTGKRATIWKDSSLIQNLEDKGVSYTGDPVTRDGLIVTAEGPDAAEDFARQIVKILEM